MIKRTILGVCVIFMILFSGCSQNSSDYVKPIKFYFPTAPGTYENGDKIISAEQREGVDYGDDLVWLLNTYLSGPISTELMNTAPAGSRVLEIRTANNRILVYMNKAFSSLDGIELSVTCSAIAMTLMDYTGKDHVIFFVEDALLDGNESIVINKENLILQDKFEILTNK